MHLQCSLGVQREIRPDLIAEVSYGGTRSGHLLINSLNINQSVPGAGAQDPSRPYYAINPNLVNVAYRTAAGDASYNSLQVHVEKRLSGGLNLALPTPTRSISPVLAIQTAVATPIPRTQPASAASHCCFKVAISSL